jgi:hypothetical protein
MNTTNEQKESNTTATAPAKTICKLGLDAHARSITVARQLDGANPQRPQRFPVPKFLTWVEEQVKKGHQVISCYEAGPTGYWLHRKLEKLGVTNYVVCPTKLDSRCKGVSNDSRDALELLVRLDRYVAGNQKAFSVVRVPTPEQEQKRALVRQRDQLRRKRLSFAAQGRMLLLGQGYRQGNSWWQVFRWEKLNGQLPEWLAKQLEVFRRLIEGVDREVNQTDGASDGGGAGEPAGGHGQVDAPDHRERDEGLQELPEPAPGGQLPGPDRRGEQQRGAARRPEHHQGGQPAVEHLFN